MTDAERPRGFKSRRSPQGMAVALFKDCNAGLNPLGRSLWASRDRASGGCSQPEERVFALGCKRPGTSREAAVRGVAPVGKGEGHTRRGAPCGQPLPNSLHPYIERLIGTLRREFLDHVLFWNTRDLDRKLEEFRDYYNCHRVHASLDGDTPAEISGEAVINKADLH